MFNPCKFPKNFTKSWYNSHITKPKTEMRWGKLIFQVRKQPPFCPESMPISHESFSEMEDGWRLNGDACDLHSRIAATWHGCLLSHTPVKAENVCKRKERKGGEMASDQLWAPGSGCEGHASPVGTRHTKRRALFSLDLTVHYIWVWDNTPSLVTFSF